MCCENLEQKEITKNNWFAALLVTAFIFLCLGYTWCYYQNKLNQEYLFAEELTEMEILVKGEVCP